MSRTVGAASPRRMEAKAKSSSRSQSAEAAVSLAYDSDQLPVLIRLPDLAGEAPASSGKQRSAKEDARSERKSVSFEPPAVPSDLTRNKRVIAEHRNSSSRKGLLSSIPSQAMILLILAVITGMAYLLIQGGPRANGGADKQAAATGTPESVAADNQAENGSGQPNDLWPAGSVGPSAEPPRATEPDIATAGEPVSPSLPTGTATGVVDSRSQEFTGGTAPAGQPPQWQDGGTTPVSAPSSETVRGWPPGMAGPSDSRSAELPSGRPTASSVESATLDGTVELPQPRVEYERTRSGVY